jgi:hypothetical protein
VDASQSSPAWDPWGPRRDNGLTGPPASSAASGPARPGSPLWWGASVGPTSSAALMSTPPPPEPLGIPASPSNRPTYNGILGSLSMNSPILQVCRFSPLVCQSRICLSGRPIVPCNHRVGNGIVVSAAVSLSLSLLLSGLSTLIVFYGTHKRSSSCDLLVLEALCYIMTSLHIIMQVTGSDIGL